MCIHIIFGVIICNFYIIRILYFIMFVGSQRHLVFSHLQPAKKITAKNCNKFFISVLSLSVRLLLFLLLVIAGDVERNPGPLSKEGDDNHSIYTNYNNTNTIIFLDSMIKCFWM